MTLFSFSNSKGFTLIEAVIAITLIAILAVVAMVRIIDTVTEAKKGARNQVVGAVREGILLTKMNSISEASPSGTYPAALDSAPNGGCGTSGSCFESVLEAGQAVNDSRWVKSGSTYRFDGGGSSDSTYTYNSLNGTFLCTSGNC